MPLIGKCLDFAGLSELLLQKKVEHCFIERAQSFPKQGVASSFNYGRHFGHLEAIVAASKVPYTLVAPVAWTRDMHQGIEKFLPSKEKSFLAVTRLFPSVDLRKNARCKKPHEGIMDALLIAAYGQRKLQCQDTSPTF